MQYLVIIQDLVRLFSVFQDLVLVKQQILVVVYFIIQIHNYCVYLYAGHAWRANCIFFSLLYLLSFFPDNLLKPFGFWKMLLMCTCLVLERGFIERFAKQTRRQIIVMIRRILIIIIIIIIIRNKTLRENFLTLHS